MLAPHEVWEIKHLLSRCQWPPNPPRINMVFSCRPDKGACIAGESMRTAACVDEDKGIIAEVLLRNFNSSNYRSLSELMFHDSEINDRIYSSLLAPVIGILKWQDSEMEVDYDDHPCEHMLSLKMSLLDVIYTFYIKALARLPSSARSARLIRALLVAGHCYGPMDPVSNIILSTIWYDIAFGVDVELPQGILSTKPLSRMVSRSLAGLVAATRLTCKSEHEALHHILGSENPQSPSTTGIAKFYAVAATAAKHPQHVAFVSFLVSLSNDKLAHLHPLLHSFSGRILDADWDMLNRFLREELACHVVPLPAQKDMEDPKRLFSFASLEKFHPSTSSTVSAEMPAFGDKLRFVRTELNKLLREYSCQHPWEPTYQLDIICGVMESSKSCYHTDSKLYHANFLAIKDDDTSSQHEATLFFAEFWGPPSSEVVQLKPSSCRPIRSHSYTGRCSVCETEASMILHPPSGGHSGDIKGPIDIYPSTVHKVLTVGFEDLESDIHYRYVQPPTGNDIPIIPWTPKAQPSLRGKRQRREVNDRRWLQELPKPLFWS